jgi:hypothetical protein
MSTGYYCLIQYCPDFSRAEAANVGLVLFQAEPNETAVRIVEKVDFVAKRLGRKIATASVLEDVQSISYRLKHELFRSVADLERFVRTRGNKIQLTMPRPMRIEAIEQDAEQLFAELVGSSQKTELVSQETREVPLLRRTFTMLAEQMPERVFVGREFHDRKLGIPIRSDYAYKNGSLNVVQVMPTNRDLDVLRRDALGMSKEGELVRDLEEGPGKLYVVSNADTKKALEQERAFGEILAKLGTTTFVPSAEVEKFARRVEAELAEQH